MMKINHVGSINEHVFTAVEKFTDEIALSCQGQYFTYRQLNLSALKLAGLLKSKGIEQQNIGILTQKTYSAYCAVLGILYAGCTYVPLNPKHPIGRLKNIIKSANIKTIINDKSESLDMDRFLKEVGGIENIIYPQSDLKDVNPLLEPVFVKPNELAYIMFTSGSTGEPKGVMVTHANVCSHIENMTHMYHFSTNDRLSQTFDLSFDPSVSDMFCAWFNGSRLCALSAEDMYCPSEYIQREAITFWASVPTLGNFMVRLGKLEDNVFPSLKHSTFCGEPFPQSLAHQWRKAAPKSTIENLYGPTEATVYVTRHVYEEQEQVRKYSNNIVPIGHPLVNQSAVIVSEDLKVLPNGQIGELCVSGSQITLGYLNDPDKTSKAFVTMPWDQDTSRKWYRTGDLAFVNNFSDLECLGRIDSQIKIGGQRIELGEIEAVLRQVSNTNDIAVVPSGYENGVPKKLVAFIAKQLTAIESQEILDSCQGLLQSAFIPKTIFSLDVLPVNASGKIDRQFLKDLAASKDK